MQVCTSATTSRESRKTWTWEQNSCSSETQSTWTQSTPLAAATTVSQWFHYFCFSGFWKLWFCSGERCVFSGNLTPSALGAHFCFSQKVTDKFQIASELEGSIAQGECTATVGYNCELDNYNFKGSICTVHVASLSFIFTAFALVKGSPYTLKNLV